MNLYDSLTLLPSWQPKSLLWQIYEKPDAEGKIRVRYEKVQNRRVGLTVSFFCAIAAETAWSETNPHGTSFRNYRRKISLTSFQTFRFFCDAENDLYVSKISRPKLQFKENSSLSSSNPTINSNFIVCRADSRLAVQLEEFLGHVHHEIKVGCLKT